MNVQTGIDRLINMISKGELSVVLRKFWKIPLFVFALPAVIALRLIRPWLLVRFGFLYSNRIGHFAANTELYLCERDAGINVPQQRYVDLFYMVPPVCNQQLAKMWKRILRIWPVWILGPITSVNRLIPGGEAHEIDNHPTNDRDVHNLMDRFPRHLQFTSEEEAMGEAVLCSMGIPTGTSFVCLIVRDSAYLNAHMPEVTDWGEHNYRDSDIQNYVLAAEELADRGYFVIRMGAKVNEPIKSSHTRVIDYATNGMRSDFADIYLGAKCEFCITVSTGFDAGPIIFRRPLVYVNMVPLGYLRISMTKLIGITKHHFSVQNCRNLTLREIFSHGVGFDLETSDYESKGIRLIENTPEEIRDVVVEMAERLNGTWQSSPDDDALQRRFWEIYPVHAKDPLRNSSPLHGRIHARFGAQFLRDNGEFLN